MEEYLNPTLYDIENQWAADDDFYLNLAKKIGGPVLDLGCGTGRLSRAIAEAGIEIIGLDIMAGMLAHAKLLSENIDIHYQVGDCRNYKIDKEFNLILMTSHGFQHLLHEEDQNKFFKCAYDHLSPDGMLAFETRNLDAKNYSSTKEFEFVKSYRNSESEEIDLHISSDYNPETEIDKLQLMRINKVTEKSWTNSTTLKYTSKEKLNSIIRKNEFALFTQYGYWDKSPFSEMSPEIISLCKKNLFNGEHLKKDHS